MKISDVNKSEHSMRQKAEAIINIKNVQRFNHLDTLSPDEIRKLVHELEVHQIELEMQNEELQRSQEELNETKKRYFDLYDLAPIGYCTLSEAGLIKEANLTASLLLGTNRNKLIKKPFSHFIQKNHQDTYYLFRKKLLEFREYTECELQLVQEDKTLFWAHLSATVETNDNKLELRLLLNNISERKKTEEKLVIAASVFSHTSEGMMITKPNGTIYDVNKAFENITGYSKEEVIGKKPSILSSGYHKKDFYRIMWDGLLKEGEYAGEIWNAHKNGQVYVEKLLINTIYDFNGIKKNYIALFSDITRTKEHVKELEHIVHYDTLTGLPNRVLLTDRLQQNMIQVSRQKQSLAVVFLDLDGFKEVNDSYGHNVGDKLLIALAKQMQGTLREGDTLARIGGDEFVAILSDLPDIKSSLTLITRLLDAAAQQFFINELPIQVSASLGITFYPQVEKIDPDLLLRQADQAMYKAKISGKNRYHIFNTEQDDFIRERFEHIQRLREALNANEFVLYYQPKVNMRTGEVIGVEALIRWLHPQKGLLQPNDFLPFIEGHILSITLGEWVMRTALEQIQQWQNMEIKIPISINISALQLLSNNFLEQFEKILLEFPEVKSSLLEIEILETSKLEDIYKASKVIKSCKKFGIHFSLDDFGTGYSSLTYLKKLAITYIKVDQSFVRDMLKDPNDLAILEGVIKLSHAFHIKVIAEGVETLEHGRTLLQLGCELAQGYIIARPMPSDMFPEWLSKWKTDSSWAKQSLMNDDQSRVLYATVEHRAWIANIDAFLKGETEIHESKDNHNCYFSKWLNKYGKKYFGSLETYNKIKYMHDNIHNLSEELLTLHKNGQNKEVLQEKFHSLHHELLREISLDNKS